MEDQRTKDALFEIAATIGPLKAAIFRLCRAVEIANEQQTGRSLVYKIAPHEGTPRDCKCRGDGFEVWYEEVEGGPGLWTCAGCGRPVMTMGHVVSPPVTQGGITSVPGKPADPVPPAYKERGGTSFVLVKGPPGSGKTEIAQMFRRLHGHEVVEYDQNPGKAIQRMKVLAGHAPLVVCTREGLPVDVLAEVRPSHIVVTSFGSRWSGQNQQFMEGVEELARRGEGFSSEQEGDS